MFNLTNVEIGKQDMINISYIYSVSILLRKRKEQLLWKCQQSVEHRKYIPLGKKVYYKITLFS
jgi:hypothetical protein